MSLDIFLSYASEDSAKAGELARTLKTEGWSIWPERSLSPGTIETIDDATALATARAVVVLWSAFSVSSSRVKEEARQARASARLVPILIEDARVPLVYRSLNSIDLRQWPEKPAPIEISKLKSIVSRALNGHNSAPDPKHPAVRDGMSLSVRVAGHMAAARNGNTTAPQAADFSLAIERGISDIFLDILKALPDTVDAKIDSYIQALAGIVRAPSVIRCTVDFSRMGISNIRSIHSSEVTATQEKTILEFVNQYCSPSGEYNLRLEPGKWPDGKMLCLPLSQSTGTREFVWFLANTTNSDWTPATQEQMLRLACGMQAGARLASWLPDFRSAS